MVMCSSAVRGAGEPKQPSRLREAFNDNSPALLSRGQVKSEEGFLRWGLCPHAPGIYRFPARMARFFGAAGAAPPLRPLGRRSGRIPALPYPPPRGGQYKPSCPCKEDSHPPKKLARTITGGVKTSCSGCAQLAGFEVTTTGRF